MWNEINPWVCVLYLLQTEQEFCCWWQQRSSLLVGILGPLIHVLIVSVWLADLGLEMDQCQTHLFGGHSSIVRCLIARWFELKFYQ